MKRRLLALAATSLAVAPAWSSAHAAGKAAQKKAPAASAPADGSEGSDGEANDSGDQAAQGETAGQEAAPGKNGAAKPPGDNVAIPTVNETHTVVKGDTLWDLSQHYLGNPWYWPKVWSYNPQIANPHWIYPGNQVRFSPQGGPTTDEEAPEQVQPVAESGDDGDEVQGNDDGETVSATRQIGYVPPKTSSFRQDDFVTDRELQESGQIEKSFAEKEMLDNYDKIYCRFKAARDTKVGDKFFIFRTVREVSHPITGQHFGYLTRIEGTARIAAVDQGMVTAVIDGTWDEIHRGDYLAPYSEKLKRAVAPKAATHEVKGYVLEENVGLEQVGEASVVFVDKGKRDGLEEGNVLEVYRRADGESAAMQRPGDSEYEDSKLPAEVVGRLLVVDVKDNASTCLTLRSYREFRPGDRVRTSSDLSTGSVSLR